MSLSGISNGASITCPGLSGGNTCTFTVGFIVSQLTQSANAQLVVAICTDANGNPFSGNPFVQSGQVSLAPGSTNGSLQGTLGPPVSNRVRFALQVNLLNSSGQTIATSSAVVNLAPQ